MKQLPKNWLLHTKIGFCISVLFLLQKSAFSQSVNYVSNPGFENSWIMQSGSSVDACQNWEAIDSLKPGYYVLSVAFGNAPYSSFGFQQPRTGKNFILSQFYCTNCPRWNPRNRLKQPLKPNTAYCAKYYVVNTNNNRVAIDSYGLYVGNSDLDTITKCNIPLTYLTPQVENAVGNVITDTLKWTPISGTFVAQGGEKYLVLGNFKSNAATNTILINPTLQVMSNDVYIDDVSLIELDLPAWAGYDSWQVAGDSSFIGREPDIGIDEACSWYQLPNMSVPIATVAGMWVKPATTSTYVVRQEICGNIKWDTVVVHESALELREYERLSAALKTYPNPANQSVEIELAPDEKIAECTIYSATGPTQKYEQTHPTNKMRLDVQDLPPGIYVLETLTDKGYRLQRKFLISR